VLWLGLYVSLVIEILNMDAILVTCFV
jgi:hypothetical protein